MELKLENLQIWASEKCLIEHFSLRITSPSLIAITGKNGVGKSTFLKSFFDKEIKTKGDIYVNNNNTKQLDYSELSRYFSYVNTQRISDEYLTVNEFISISKDDNMGVESYIEKFNANDLINRKILQLSDGEFQKVAILRAVLQNTPILLLDEPTSFLDYKNKKHILNLIKEISKYKIVLISTHDIQLIKDYADKGLHFANKKAIWFDEITPEWDLLFELS